MAGGAAGLVMGGAMGMFSLTSAGQAFGKWMSEPTKLDMKAAQMVKSFWGNNRGSVGFGGSDKNSKHMFGINGTQVSSKTTWQNGKTERIDVENPLPGERPGQVHYHDANNNKYYYNADENTFYNQKTGELAPKNIQKLLNNNDFMKGIKKALIILGE